MMPGFAFQKREAPPMSQPHYATIQSTDSQASMSLYGLEFWVAYVANLLVVTSNTLIFRFSEYVVELGGSAADAGFIIGMGTGVSILLRIWLGRVVDQTGPRWLWIASATALTVSSLAFIPLHGLGPGIYAVRIVYACGLAGVFSCSVIHLCTNVPPLRRAELIGTLGTSGFIGAIIGPQLGDWMFQSSALYEQRFFLMFALAGLINGAYLLLVAYLTRHSVRPAPHEPAPLFPLLATHWPGTLAAVAMMMGVALAVPATFLTLFRDYQGLDGIGKFFWCYAPTAIVMRLAGRHWPGQLSRRIAAFVGLLCLMTSMLLYLLVQTEWDLAWPAVAAGTGQALLFPAVTTLGAESFPERYRGTGTTLILGFVDFGALCGAPALGLIIDHFGFRMMFVCAAMTILLIAVVLLFSTIAHYQREERQRADRQAAQPAVASEEQLVEW
jgi:MFS family permease